MARGDVVALLDEIADAADLTIQPPSLNEWVIHNLYFGATCDVKITNGTDEITIEAPGGGGLRVNRTHHLTHSQYMLITNTSGGSAVFGYDGICTKGV